MKDRTIIEPELTAMHKRLGAAVRAGNDDLRNVRNKLATTHQLTDDEYCHAWERLAETGY
jgi:hypothetical protein